MEIKTQYLNILQAYLKNPEKSSELSANKSSGLDNPSEKQAGWMLVREVRMYL